MTRSYFTDLMEEQGCRVLKGTALGVNKYGMPYSAQLEKAGTAPVLKLRFALEAPAAPCIDYFSENPVEYATAYSRGNIIEFIVELPTDFYTKATLHSIHKNLNKACEITGNEKPVHCPLCGFANCDAYAWLNVAPEFFEQAFVPTHSACVEEKLDGNAEDSEVVAEFTGSYIRGFIGAFLGAFIGLMPNWMQLVSKAKVSTILYFLIPIFSALVYRLLRGKQKHGYASCVIAAASIFAAFSFEQYGFKYSFEILNSTTITWAESISLYIENIGFGIALKNMFFSLIMMFVGFLPASRLLQGYTKGGRREVKIVRGSSYSRESSAGINEFKSESENEHKTAAEHAEENSGENDD